MPVEPRTASEIEQRLLAMWCDALAFEEVTLDDSFLDLGGDSIAATRCVNLIRAAFGVEVTIDQLFAATSVRALAGQIATGDLLHHGAIASRPALDE
jgi:acyl carrier protein